MVIAVDFDGTIVEHKYPKIGRPVPFAIDALKQLINEGHRLILWTVREGELLQEAIEYCEKAGVYFYAYNSNFPEEERQKSSRKISADLFIDDRNFGGLPDWGEIYQAIHNNRSHNLSFKSSSEKGLELKEKNAGFWGKLFK
jgi:hydroxymethylpyrimidine pyrophosphatase-like HAD family hydrolase